MPVVPFDPSTPAAPPPPTAFDPNAAPPPPQPVRSVITALTGGGSQALDGQHTALWKLGEAVVVTADGVAIWQLQTGAQATDTDAGYVRPADFHADTNAKVFRRVHWQGKLDAEAAAAEAEIYADAAGDAAEDAAASAQAAAHTLAAQYLGGVDGAAVPATAPAAGHYHTITAAGTSQGETWAVGDLAIYTGTSGNWTRLATGAYGFATRTAVWAGDSHRATAPWLWTAGGADVRAEWTLGAHGDLRGSPLTLLTRPFTSPAASGSQSDRRQIATLTAANTATVAAREVSTPASLNVYYIGNGLRIQAQRDGAQHVHYRRLEHATFRSTWAGQTIQLAIVWAEGDSTTPPTVWLRSGTGVEDISAQFAESTSGTFPKWLDANATFFSTTSLWAGYGWPGGDVPEVVPINGGLSAAEVTAYLTTGRLPAWAARPGSCVNRVVNSDFASFTGTADDGTADTFAGWSVGGNLSAFAIAGGIRVLVASAEWSANLSAFNYVGQSMATELGRRYLFAVRARALGATTSMRFNRRGSGGTAAQTTVLALTADWQTFRAVVEITADGAHEIGFGPNNGGAIGVDGIEVAFVRFYDVGALTMPVPQAGSVLGDASGNRQCGKLTGMRAANVGKESHVAVDGANGLGFPANVNLFLGEVQPPRSVIESVVYERSVGSGTFRLGTTMGGTDVSAVIADAAGCLDGTSLSSRVNTGATARPLWAITGANTTVRYSFKFRSID